MLASYISPSNRRFASALNSCVLTSPSFSAFTPLSLFSGGVQGVWYDPSDLTTMFEDSAGTTAVHTPGNGTADSPVGKILDKSGNGNHATQSTSTKRPTLSAKYNLLTYTEDFSNAAWTKNNVTITSNTTTDPLGGNTASTYTANATSNAQLYQLKSVTSPTATYTFSVFLKKNSARYGFVNAVFGGSDDRYAVAIDLQTGTFVSSATLNSPANKSYVISDSGNGWYKLSVSCSSATATGSVYLCVGGTSVFPIVFDGGLFVSTAVNDSVYIWGADLRATNDGVGLPAYQRVVDANTYDSVGFPYYLKSDGVDDGMQTAGNVDFTGTDAVSTWNAHRTFNIISYTPLFGLTADVNTNNGSFTQWDSNTATHSPVFYSRGTVLQSAGKTLTPAVQSITVYGAAKISTPIVSVGYNGGALTSIAASQGTGNYSNSILYIFLLSSTSFNGRIYGIIIRGAASTAAQISNTETWLNGKAKIY